MDDLYLTGDNFLSDLIQEGIGQLHNCPVIFVGHRYGSVVIKEILLCCSARITKFPNLEGAKFEKFLASVRGIFPFGRPRRCSADFSRCTGLNCDNMLFRYSELLRAETARLNYEFDQFCHPHPLSDDVDRLNDKFGQLCHMYPEWRIVGLEGGFPRLSGFVIPEASARYDVDRLCTVQTAHFDRPNCKTDTRFYALK